jgi:hypothetical protein
MATGSILLTPGSAVLPDGSASNAAPAISRQQSTAANPKPHFLTLDFDASADEHAWWIVHAPADYASAGTVKIDWFANATTGTCRWGVKIGAVTAGDADTPLEHAMATATTAGTATNATEANRLNSTSIDCSSNLDSLAAGDLLMILIYRDGDGTSGTDDLSVDAKLAAAAFEYTTT